MDDSEAASLEQIQDFLAGSAEVRFAGQHRGEVYGPRKMYTYPYQTTVWNSRVIRPAGAN